MKRRSLSVQGQLYETVLAYADANGVSISSVFQAAMVAWLEERGTTIPEGIERETQPMSATRRKNLVRAQSEGREKKHVSQVDAAKHFTF